MVLCHQESKLCVKTDCSGWLCRSHTRRLVHFPLPRAPTSLLCFHIGLRPGVEVLSMDDLGGGMEPPWAPRSIL